jgi:5-formyltetrahydrofolate cyclo-ligase
MSEQSDHPDLPPLAGGTARPEDADRRGALRRLVRTFRAALTTEERLEASEQAAARLLPVLSELRRSLPEARRGSPVVALSVPVDGEIDSTGVAADLRSDGWTVVLPVVLDDRNMEFREWRAGGELARGRFRVLEPLQGEVLEPDIVVVPCVAVDAAGNRLGFGKGFYDRALGSGPRPVAVGAVFDEQVVAAVPVEPWDVPLDVVVTPTRVIRPDR